MCSRDEAIPGTIKYRRSMCGCGANGHRHELHAFQPKWCSSSPAFGISSLPTSFPYDDEAGSTSTTPRASCSPLCFGLSSATNASFSAGACPASLGEGWKLGSGRQRAIFTPLERNLDSQKRCGHQDFRAIELLATERCISG